MRIVRKKKKNCVSSLELLDVIRLVVKIVINKMIILQLNIIIIIF